MALIHVQTHTHVDSASETPLSLLNPSDNGIVYIDKVRRGQFTDICVIIMAAYVTFNLHSRDTVYL